MKKQFKSIFFLLIVMSILLTACGGAKSETIRIASDTTWPPFEYIDETTKEPVGFDIDLITMIAEKEGLDIEIIPTEWDALLAGISQCQYDAAISAITITEDRKETMLFTEPYIEAGQVLTIVAGDDRISSIADLDGMTVGAQIGTTGAIEVEGMAGATLKTYDSVDLAYLDLTNGQIDVVVADYPTAFDFVAQSNGELALTGEVFTDENYGIAVCNENADLLTKLNAGLKAVQDEGGIAPLEAKWLAGE
ncbi:MAG: basic amino acid ABC transporter substrate-binding protein [Anaerolineaceae bacterium]|nr:basic amino acid ABC transporter substrate-binding protein [Anaerolineaceae bacterium]